MESRLGALVNMVKLVIDALMGVRIKLSQLRRDKPITAGDFTDIFDEATSAISGGIMDAYFKTIGTRSSNPSYEEERKRELLEKAKRREISQEEGEELRRLLERQKREREAAGDILGAIMLGLLILFIIGVLAALFGRRD